MQAVALTSAMLVASAAAIPSVPLGATPCAGKAPGWCKKWKVDNAPFYNCSGSDELAPAQCTAWQAFFDQTNGSQWKACRGNRIDPCACHGGKGVGHGAEAAVYCKGDHIESIALEQNSLTGAIPEVIGEFTDIKHLELENNKFTGTIPESLANLVNLESLDLGGEHRPSGADGLTGEVPAWFNSKFTELQYLNLALNKLTGTIPASIATMPKLKDLYLYDNHLHGRVPELPFHKYNYCGIGTSHPPLGGTNEFCEPLPAGAKACREEGNVRTKGTCPK